MNLISEFDYMRLRDAIERSKVDEEIWIIARNIQSAKFEWGKIESYFKNSDTKPIFITNNEYSLDGKDPSKAWMVLINGWWENKNVAKLLSDYIPMAKYCFQIGHIRYAPEGGD
ncbi:hypothetical protein [Bacillus mesophilum]|uniref:Uncharacterized protein n=1 Tax=Bacillus mesophilum TaxID=1071718 RepID=A0A7V7RNV9_9BACI|nr:hypothetical protein [Bacillus mesophilum]KAB2334265.1 hypothetical protein F7732_09345 [Bacillus mesophilum]